MLETIEDINGDGIVDMMISAEGTLSGLQLLDLNSDNLCWTNSCHAGVINR